MKRLSLLIAMLLIGTLLMSCSSPGDSNTGPDGTPAPTAQGSSTAGQPEAQGQESPYWKIYDPPITLTQNFEVSEDDVGTVPAGMSFDENFWTEWAYDTYGIKFKSSWISTNAEQGMQRMNLAIINDELPDIIGTDGAMLSNLIDAGKVMPLDVLIDEFGSPLLKYLIQTANAFMDNTFSMPFSKNGSVYGMSYFGDVWSHTWFHNWIRKDILDALGLNMPNTIEEFEAVMEAYKETTPNGLAIRLSAGSQDSVLGMVPVADAYGAYPGKWVDDGSGGLTFGSIQPQMKNVLAKLAEWYQKGWIDPEFVVKDQSIADQRVANGDILMHDLYWWAVWNTIPDTYANIPEADFVAIPSFLQENGERKMVLPAMYNSGTGCWAISADCENPEAIIYMFNIQLDNYYRNDDNMRNLMKELYDYDFMFDPYEKRLPLNADEVDHIRQYIYDYPDDIGGGVLNGFGKVFGFEYRQGPTELYGQFSRMLAVERGELPESAWLLVDDEEKAKMTMPHNRWPALMSSVDMYTKTLENDKVVYDGFVGEPTPSMKENNAYLNKITMETFCRIIMGQDSIDTFDTYVENWLAAGGQKIIDEVNEWYRSIQ